MRIKSISLLNFKNIEEANLSFSKELNFLFGNNGMGKTNLLDALFYLAFCKSYLHLPDSQLIEYGKDFCMLSGVFESSEEKEEVIHCGIKKGRKKVFKRNKKPYERLSDHIGLIPLVMVSPSDVDLIYGGSEERRKFIDMLISQYDKKYLSALISYNKALAQRNSLLKAGKVDYSLFEIFDFQLASEAEIIYERRKSFISDFLPLFNAYYREISGGFESVGLVYSSQMNRFEEFVASLKSSFALDKELGYTSKGIHKDDFEFILNEHLIRKVGSQGQNKTFLIALKLSQFNILSLHGEETPILLLDDIFDKLDSYRVEQIIGIVSQSRFGQIFITDTNRQYLNEILEKIDADSRLFYVENGKVKTVENS